MSELVPSGIDGLDALIGGGFNRGDITLLVGGTGSGKTIFATQFIYNGAKDYGEKGVYATYEEDAKSLRRNMNRFGFDLEKLEREESVRLMDSLLKRPSFGSSDGAASMEGLYKSIKDGKGLSQVQSIVGTLEMLEGKRLVIDSLTAFLSSFGDEYGNRVIMNAVYRLLKNRDITTIMTCSVPVGSKTLGLGIEEFIADSVIVLENVIDNLELKTRLMIRKMRGTKHSRTYHNVIVTDKGLKIMPFGV